MPVPKLTFCGSHVINGVSQIIVRRFRRKYGNLTGGAPASPDPPTSSGRGVRRRAGRSSSGGAFVVGRGVRILNNFQNFEWACAPQTWLRSASNLAKTRFGRSPTFYFSTVKKSIFCKKLTIFERPFILREELPLT